MNNEKETIPQKIECNFWKCPNVKPEEGDLSMEKEWYICEKCGKRDCLYYDEMQ